MPDDSRREGDARALHPSEQRYRALVEAMPHGVEEIDLEGRVTFANEALGRILGCSAEQLVGSHVWSHHADPADHKRLRDYVRNLKNRRPKPEPYFGKNVTQDGRSVNLRVDWNYRYDADGTLIGYVSVVTDVTEALQGRRALEQSKAELARRVDQRTRELAEANRRLEQEVRQRRDTERYIRQSHEFLQSVIDALSAHVAVLDADGRIVLVNRIWREFAEVNGLRHDAHGVGLNYFDVCREARGHSCEGAVEAAEGIRQVLDGHRDTCYLEYPCHSTSPDDPDVVIERRWFQMRATRFLHAGKAWSIVAHENITELKAIAEQLRESEARYRSISQLVTNHAYSFRVHADGTLENEWTVGHFGQITGYTTEELHSRGGWQALIHPDDRPVADRRAARLMAGEQDVSEFRVVGKSGEVRWLRDYGQPIRDDENGHVVRIVGAAQDITHRKQNEEALRASEQRFRVVFERSPLGIATASANGRFLSANPAFCRMVDYSLEELRDMTVDRLTHPDDLARNHVARRRIERRGTDAYTIEKRYVRKDGTVVWVHLTAAGVFDDQGAFSYGLVLVEDITERKQAEELLRRAERLAAIGTLAAGIAHEVNNPLHGITLYSEAALLAKDQPDGGTTRDTLLKKIQNEAMRCGRLVRSVLQFARREESEKWSQPIDRLLRQAHDLTRRQAIEHEVDVEIDVPDDLAMLYVNPTAIEQVFVNLLSNAIEACEPGGRVKLTAAADDRAVSVTVEDNGCGITEQQSRSVFDPFYTTRQHLGGTGLGLSISYGIVRDHGGTIELNSRPGVGTTMKVVLPRRPGDGPPTADPQ